MKLVLHLRTILGSTLIMHRLIPFGGRPPIRPRALAALSLASALSRIRSRSNSANVLKIWKINLPLLVVVSIDSCRLLK